MTVTSSFFNLATAALLSLAIAFICWDGAPARTIEVQKTLAIVVKEKPAAGTAKNEDAAPDSSQSNDDADSQDNDEDDDDASPDDDQVYAT